MSHSRTSFMYEMLIMSLTLQHNKNKVCAEAVFICSFVCCFISAHCFKSGYLEYLVIKLPLML